MKKASSAKTLERTCLYTLRQTMRACRVHLRHKTASPATPEDRAAAPKSAGPLAPITWSVGRLLRWWQRCCRKELRESQERQAADTKELAGTMRIT